MTCRVLLTLGASLLPLLAFADPVWPDLSQIPPRSGGDGSLDAALVIGIETYDRAQDIPGARQNATDWARWLREARGVTHVEVLLDDQATKEEIEARVIPTARRVGEGGRMWIVYIGHGAPASDGTDGLLVGSDARQTALSLEARSVRRRELLDLADLAMGGRGDILLVQDACFSGKTEAGDLAPGLAPLQVVDATIGSQVTVLSAARSDQYAGALPDHSRPAFSYLALAGLAGWADLDQDGTVTSGELLRFTHDAMLTIVRGRQQTPDLEGSPHVVVGPSAGWQTPDLLDLATRSTEVEDKSVEGVAERIRREQAERDRSERDAAEVQRRREQALQDKVREATVRAERDFNHLQPLLLDPTPEALPVLELWSELYDGRTLTHDGLTHELRPVEAKIVSELIAALRGPSTPAPARRDPVAFVPGERTSVPGPAPRWVSPSGYPMRRIDAGTYEQGVESPNALFYHLGQATVTFDYTYLIGEHEVTQGLWREVMGSNPSANVLCGDMCPVDGITWWQAVQFANKLSERDGLTPCYTIVPDRVPNNETVRHHAIRSCDGYRLPHQSEWEVAARAGRRSWQPGTIYVDAVAWTMNTAKQPVRVGRKLPNGFGLFDTAGNVQELMLGMQREQDKDKPGYPDHPPTRTYDRADARGGSVVGTPTSLFTRARVRVQEARAKEAHQDRPTGLRLVRTVP